MVSNSNTPAFVELIDVTRTYTSRYDSVTALDNINLTIGPGERLALLGRSGSGKSTLLNLLGGLDQPTSGTITVGDQRLDSMTSEEMATYRLKSVGMIFQAFNLIPSRTALQNVEIPFIFGGQSWFSRRKKSRVALEQVGLGKRIRHRPAQLSGGEQQRVAIARALAQQPSLLLADEPTGNLDSATAQDIMELLTRFSDENNCAVVLVTHDEELAVDFAHRVIRLRDGKLGESA